MIAYSSRTATGPNQDQIDDLVELARSHSLAVPGPKRSLIFLVGTGGRARVIRRELHHAVTNVLADGLHQLDVPWRRINQEQIFRSCGLIYQVAERFLDAHGASLALPCDEFLGDSWGGRLKVLHRHAFERLTLATARQLGEYYPTPEPERPFVAPDLPADNEFHRAARRTLLNDRGSLAQLRNAGLLAGILIGSRAPIETRVRLRRDDRLVRFVAACQNPTIARFQELVVTAPDSRERWQRLMERRRAY